VALAASARRAIFDAHSRIAPQASYATKKAAATSRHISFLAATGVPAPPPACASPRRTARAQGNVAAPRLRSHCLTHSLSSAAIPQCLGGIYLLRAIHIKCDARTALRLQRADCLSRLAAALKAEEGARAGCATSRLMPRKSYARRAPTSARRAARHKRAASHHALRACAACLIFASPA